MDITILLLLGNYGIRGMEMFTDLASSYNICVATTDTVASSDRDHEFDQVVTRLQLTQQASVVVCFCEGITVKKLLSAIKRKDVYGKFLIIGRYVRKRFSFQVMLVNNCRFIANIFWARTCNNSNAYIVKEFLTKSN